VSPRQRVVVAGAGPVGLTVAIELWRRGLKPILLDPRREIAWSSRAICISRRSQEIFRRIGINEGFFDKALPWSSGKTFHRDHLVFQFQMPFSDADRFAPGLFNPRCARIICRGVRAGSTARSGTTPSRFFRGAHRALPQRRVARVRQLGRAYVAPALESPELFRTMFLFPPELANSTATGARRVPAQQI